jgi:chromosome segregation ATPase
MAPSVDDDDVGHYTEILSHFNRYVASIPEPEASEFKKKFLVLLETTEKSFNQLQRFIARISDLNASILSFNTQLRSAIAVNQDDSNTINNLKRDLDRVWKQTELSKAREQEARQKLETLNQNIDAIQADIEHGCPSSDKSAEIAKMGEKRLVVLF